jgi:RNA ligase (TIGR02306 family)
MTENEVQESSPRLATIQRVESLTPIPNADSIECARVMGWDVVVRKGDFKVGDFGVFIVIDSIVPDIPEFAFLKDKHFRLRTVKLRGQVSQGLFMHLGILAGLANSEGEGAYADEGFDVTSLLGVTKYEKEIPAQLRGQVKGTRPGWLPKTDETQIQSAKYALDEIWNEPVYTTLKCDGSSATYFYKEGVFGVCSRNMEYKVEDTNAFCNWARAHNLQETMTKYGREIAIRGELCGPGIQKNNMGLKEISFFVFDIMDIQTRKYLDFASMQQIIQELGLTQVPVINQNVLLKDFLEFTHGVQSDLLSPLDALLVFADKQIYPSNNSLAEGIVIRPMHEMMSQALRGRLSFKVVSRPYQLKREE